MSNAALEHKATITKPSEREIRVERVLSAPRAAVWKALVEHEEGVNQSYRALDGVLAGL